MITQAINNCAWLLDTFYVANSLWDMLKDRSLPPPRNCLQYTWAPSRASGLVMANSASQHMNGDEMFDEHIIAIRACNVPESNTIEAWS